MPKNIDIRGIFGVFLQLSGLDIAADEMRVLLYLIAKTGISHGRKITRNISEFSKYTRTPRFNVKRALKKLKDKGLIEETGIYVSLFANPNRKDVEGRGAQSHPLYYLKFLARTKGIDNIAWLRESHLLDKELDYGFFNRFFPETSEEDTLSRLRMDHPHDLSIPYSDNIYIREKSSDFSPIQDPAAGASSKKQTEGNTPAKKAFTPAGLTVELLNSMLNAEPPQIGRFTGEVCKAFVELGDSVSMARIDKEIKPWLAELMDVYQITSDDLDWCRQTIFNWKQYYKQEKHRSKLTDCIGSLSAFFNNARRPK